MAADVRKTVSDLSDIDEIFNAHKKDVYKGSPRLNKEGNTVYLEYHQCGCPMVEAMDGIDAFLCNCTKGHAKAIYETLFGREVDVEIQQSILNGDPICKLAITVQS